MSNCQDNQPSYYVQHPWSWADEWSVLKMDWLTRLGRQMLPSGYWGVESSQSTVQKTACLTFDDGPNPHTTPRLLELLETQGVRASFFLIGKLVAKHQGLVEQIARAGHLICNHSLNHHFLPLLSMGRLEKEIDATNQVIAEITGQSPTLFRPPYGILDARAADCLKDRQMVPVYWSCVPEDWHGPGAAAVTNRVMRRLQGGAVIVLHERRYIAEQTLTAAKQIICRGREFGYEFVGIPEILC